MKEFIDYFKTQAIPEGFYTAKQLAEGTGVHIDTMRTRLDMMVRRGDAECMYCRVNMRRIKLYKRLD